MKKKYALIIMIALVLFNCRKKEPLPDEPSGDPVFYIEGKLNGVPLQFQAGNNDYFMNASFERTLDNLYTFRGDLKQTCIGNCGYSASLLINDYRATSNGAAIFIDSAIHTGKYFFNNQTNWPDVRDVAFVPNESEDLGKEYSWKISDESGVVLSSPLYSVTTSLSTKKTYTITHISRDFQGTCNSTLTSILSPGNSFQSEIKTTRNDTNVSFNATTSVSGNYTYSWEFGDGTTGTGQNPVHQYQSENNYTVKLTVKNDKNENSVTFYQVNTSSTNVCESNFKSQLYALNFSRVFRTITVLLVDPSGKVYTSELASQLSGDVATITEVTDYDKTKDGKLTKKIKFQFNCVLKGSSGDMRLTDVNAVMAVGYE